jgi:hypothetical protein
MKPVAPARNRECSRHFAQHPELDVDGPRPTVDRSVVVEAVREIAAIQRRMTNVARYVPAEGWVAAERP